MQHFLQNSCNDKTCCSIFMIYARRSCATPTGQVQDRRSLEHLLSVPWRKKNPHKCLPYNFNFWLFTNCSVSEKRKEGKNLKSFFYKNIEILKFGTRNARCGLPQKSRVPLTIEVRSPTPPPQLSRTWQYSSVFPGWLWCSVS